MPEPIHFQDDHIEVAKLVVGPLETNAYVVASRRTGDAVLIDAADDPGRLVSALGGLTLRAVMTTHGHWDHVQAVEGVVEATGAPFLIHAADEQLAGRRSDRVLTPGTLTAGELELEVIHTPGHTPGSTCFAIGDVVFTGDTLFPGGPGKTTGGADFDQIIAGIETLLFTRPDGTLVMPGHGADTTIGNERPQLGEWIARRW